jgi:uncharacterized membrane protein YvbJ
MTYCTKCGEKNSVDAKYCVKCGNDLDYLLEKNVESGIEKSFEKSAEQFGERMEKWGEDFGKRAENECFGLPNSGAILGLLIGIIIIFVGLQQVLGWQIDFGPLATIIVGGIFVAGAIYGLIRRKS